MPYIKGYAKLVKEFESAAQLNTANEVDFQTRPKYSITTTDAELKQKIKAAAEGDVSFTDSHVMIGSTPEYYAKFGFDTSLPVLMTTKHIKDITTAKDGIHTEYHGLTQKQLFNAMKKLDSPVIIISSQKKDGTLVIITDEVDNDKNPISLYLRPDGYGFYETALIPINIMVSAYGREHTDWFISTAFYEGRVLDVNRERSQRLASIPGVSFPNNMPTTDFNKSIACYKTLVNSIISKNNENVQKKRRYSISEQDRETKILKNNTKTDTINSEKSAESGNRGQATNNPVTLKSPESTVKENEETRETEGASKAKNPLPNFNNAKIDPKKLTDYALNPEHTVGGNKAIVFENVLGYNKSNAYALIKQVYGKLHQSETVMGKLDQYGQRYTVDMSITGANSSTATVRTGRILKPGSTTPELTTIYVK